jgi:hypothetical protein
VDGVKKTFKRRKEEERKEGGKKGRGRKWRRSQDVEEGEGRFKEDQGDHKVGKRRKKEKEKLG